MERGNETAAEAGYRAGKSSSRYDSMYIVVSAALPYGPSSPNQSLRPAGGHNRSVPCGLWWRYKVFPGHSGGPAQRHDRREETL